MYDRGTGPPVIVVPGVQGRWEWMKPALDVMSERCRTISYSLAGDFGSGLKRDPNAGFEAYLQQLESVMDRAGVERAAICGVSYGGFIALRFAATRPSRTSALILVSAPAPGWVPNDRQGRYIARPWRSTAAFVATGPSRVWPEIKTAFDRWTDRLRFVVVYGLRVLSAPASPSLMAERVTLQQGLDFAPDCEQVKAPALVITGEPHLDPVVPVEVTRRYRSLLPGSRYVMMERTGHNGLVTMPRKFSELVCGFVHAHDH